MPAKKKRPVTKRKTAVSKKKTAKTKTLKKPASTRKAASKKTARRKPASASKKRTTRKTAAKKKATKKKVARKKAVAKKKTSTSKKTATRKVTAKKKAGAKKKPSTKKKAASKKKPAAAKRPAASKKAARKKPTRKASVKKKPAARRTKSRSTAKRRAQLLTGPIHGVEPYERAANEVYMSDDQLGHFENILLNWKRELMEEVDRTVHHMKDEAANFPDPNDRATQESEFGLELRTRDRERKLLRKIDAALARIEDGTYGYCEETGEEIGLKRLEARPVATLCLEAQERRELAEKQFRDRDDRYR